MIDIILKNIPSLFALVLSLSVIILLYIPRFLRYIEYREYEKTHPPVPQFDPKDFDIYEASFLHNGRFESENLGAYVTDLAIKKYIIIENFGKELYGIKSNLEYQNIYSVDPTTQHIIFLLEKASPLGKETDGSFWKKEMKKIVASLFFLRSRQSEKEILKEFLYKQTVSAAKDASKRLHEKKLVTHVFSSVLFENSLLQNKEKEILIVIFFLSLIGLFVLFSPGTVTFFGMIVSVIFIEKFFPYLPSLTEKGFEARRYVQGLYLYINQAEKHRIELLNKESLTPEQHEKLLPFAMVFGLEKKWTKAFESFGVIPEWYQEGIIQGISGSGLRVSVKGEIFITALRVIAGLRK